MLNSPSGRRTALAPCSTRAVHPCTFWEMPAQRLNISLDEERAAKLARLASRTHMNEGTLARSLLSAAIDDADPNVDAVVGVLEGIDGAWERAHLGREQAASGETVQLGEL